MKITTWNVNSLKVRLPQVLAWLQAHQPDALCLQETKTEDGSFPSAEIANAGYQSVFAGQKTYNGVALITRSAALEVVKNIPGFDDDMARVITATVNGVRVVGAYFPNGQEPGSDKFAYKMQWLNALRAWIKHELSLHPMLTLMGDYNITVDDRDVHDPVALAGTIHCTDEERAHFQGLIELGLSDAFRLFNSEGKLYSWWDYREFAFKRNRGLRIDHILVSDALRAKVTACSSEGRAAAGATGTVEIEGTVTALTACPAAGTAPAAPAAPAAPVAPAAPGAAPTPTPGAICVALEDDDGAHRPLRHLRRRVGVFQNVQSFIRDDLVREKGICHDSKPQKVNVPVVPVAWLCTLRSCLTTRVLPTTGRMKEYCCQAAVAEQGRLSSGAGVSRPLKRHPGRSVDRGTSQSESHFATAQTVQTDRGSSPRGTSHVRGWAIPTWP